MRIAIISDIHGNMEALVNVFDDIAGQKVSDTIAVGDLIGYGPEPDKVVKLIRNHNIISVMGNHELALCDRRYLRWFNPSSKESLLKTAELMSQESTDYVGTLKPYHIQHNCRFVHGFPPDSITRYVFQVHGKDLRLAFEAQDEWICFVGHTHFLEIVEFDGKHPARWAPGQGITKLEKDFKYIINAGSVGQPRDGNNNAKYMILDTDTLELDVRFVPYNASLVADKIISAGFPRGNAERLL